jgi:phenylalanyl-tRNA synthetase beta subunit
MKIDSITKNNKYNSTIFNFSQKLLYKGFNELVTYKLISNEEKPYFNFFHFYTKLELMNPIVKNKSFIRTNPIISILKVIQYNIEHKRKIQPLFEFSSV